MWLPDHVHDELRQLCEDIWSCPEPSGDEQFAQQRLTDMLRSRDFFVMPGYLLPTAFCAELVFTEDSGPTICLVCEYDAVRGLGHAWGHNLASTASMAAALAVQMEAAQPVRIALVVVTHSSASALFLEITRVTYHGRESSAVLCPWQGINAQDAAVAAYRNVTLLRRDLPPQWHVAGV
ncbi:peptidase M20 domain-containing protein 2-like [Dermacentor variabilis]|uniref:peptidase M20 domain-containing protein 2-like n=1 Tax=Dermacentor variabilis TaxID=34621 RepID=UPI003F5C4ECC